MLDRLELRRRLSMNQATVPRWSTPELLEGCARAGYGGAGLWRHRVQEIDLAGISKLAQSLGVQISSLCRGGSFLVAGSDGLEHRAEDNRRAVDEAWELRAQTLVVVCGPAPGRDLRGAREAVADAIADLASYARSANMPLAIEAMHPLYCADRSVVVTLAQALSMAATATQVSGARVGVMLDSYHLWWDPDLESSVHQAAGHILGLQLADWVVPLSDPLNGRGMLGDGSIDFGSFRRLVSETGYRGLDEVEIFNPAIWERDPAEVTELTAARYEQHVAPGLVAG
jgi:sugar phosphate isomerase/epimerase